MSSARNISSCVVLFLCLVATGPGLAVQSGVPGTNKSSATGAETSNPAQLFDRGDQALRSGNLDEAERDFRAVLAVDRNAGAAYANLGVVYMRRKQWGKALEMLHHAEQLMPQVAGIRLNIGLAYFRQNEFLKAIPPFESVVHEQPDAEQPRYLLGLCYFFAERWADATNTLEPLWEQESGKLPYLYVLSNAAHRAGKKELDERAATQLIKLGDNTPQYHLFAAKYHLNQGQYDEAVKELEAALQGDPKLPFAHFNLGLAYLKKQEFERARDEFMKDAEIEPDLALNYDELGDVYWLMQQDENAEKSYRRALGRDPRLVNPRLGLAKIYQKRGDYAAALKEIDAAEKLDAESAEIHYVRGQVLGHLQRKTEAKKELDAAVHLREKQESHSVPAPELLEPAQ